MVVTTIIHNKSQKNSIKNRLNLHSWSDIWHIMFLCLEYDAAKKRFIVAVGRSDKKAFYINTRDKTAFPPGSEDQTLSLEERYSLRNGMKFNLFWSDNILKKQTLVVAIFFKFGRD